MGGRAGVRHWAVCGRSVNTPRRLFFQLRLYAVRVKRDVALFVGVLNQAVNVGFKARAVHAQLARKAQVIHNFFVKYLAGHQQRNARRLGRD